ncbi:MAG: SDR family NAD(P)-dependent oxidoreductase, partial [Alicyclobacillus sp.]|nr:SDR family NAD(P)-dependent oxidoreductase [Alicyclobacillus sp.]
MGKVHVDLTGSVALVTGAGRGLGRGIARALAESGAKVACVSRTRAELDELVAELKRAGHEGYAVTCDVTQVNDIRRMVEEVMAWSGQIDILVHSAGINIPQMALDVEEEQWDKVLDTNLKGGFFCSQAVARHMIPRRRGKIIHLSSTMSMVGFYQRAAYCASKGGLKVMSQVLAVEWAPYNIQVNCVAPT